MRFMGFEERDEVNESISKPNVAGVLLPDHYFHISGVHFPTGSQPSGDAALTVLPEVHINDMSGCLQDNMKKLFFVQILR